MLTLSQLRSVRQVRKTNVDGQENRGLISPASVTAWSKDNGPERNPLQMGTFCKKVASEAVDRQSKAEIGDILWTAPISRTLVGGFMHSIYEDNQLIFGEDDTIFVAV